MDQARRVVADAARHLHDQVGGPDVIRELRRISIRRISSAAVASADLTPIDLHATQHLDMSANRSGEVRSPIEACSPVMHSPVGQAVAAGRAFLMDFSRSAAEAVVVSRARRTVRRRARRRGSRRAVGLAGIMPDARDWR